QPERQVAQKAPQGEMGISERRTDAPADALAKFRDGDEGVARAKSGGELDEDDLAAGTKKPAPVGAALPAAARQAARSASGAAAPAESSVAASKEKQMEQLAE